MSKEDKGHNPYTGKCNECNGYTNYFGECFNKECSRATIVTVATPKEKE